MKDLMHSLDKNHFIRVHKSFIVAVQYILSVNGHHVKLKLYDDRLIPIGSLFKAAFQQWVNQKMLSR